MKFFTTTINLPAWWVLLGVFCLLILAADHAMRGPEVRANSPLVCQGEVSVKGAGASTIVVGGYNIKVTCQ